MAVVQISRLIHRRGLRIDLPNPLNGAEFGWAENTRELFIGNGPFFGGNTQIITDVSPAALPSYNYLSNTGFPAKTGFDLIDPSIPDSNIPTIRSYQEKFDDIVNVRDYGAVGDFSINDTGALIRAMRDLYDEASGNDNRKFRALYFPAGIYRISQAFPLYPFCNLIGDGKGRTIIFLDFTLGVNPSIAFPTDNTCVARTVDSKGDSGFNIGGDSPQRLPQNIRVSGITFESNTPQTETSSDISNNGGKKEIIKLDRVKKVLFDDCEFVGTYSLGDGLADLDILNNGSNAIVISSLEPNFSIDMTGYTFLNCTYRNLVHAFVIKDTVEDVYIFNGDFNNLNSPIRIGKHPSLIDVGDGNGKGANPPTPRLFRVANSRFTDYEEIAFDIRSAGVGNISTYNHYSISSNSEPAVRFAPVSNSCVSIGDTFDETGFFSCANKLSNLRVQNHSTNNSNVVMNVQDEFQIPFGFCGNIVINGNLQVNGDLLVSGSIVNVQGSVVPFDGTLVTSIPYTSGNIIHFEYGMNLGGPGPSGTYRAGTMRIAHNGDGTGGLVVPSAITFDDSYTEISGPPDDLITLEAVLGSGNVNINVSTVGPIPTFNFTTRIMTV